MALPRKVQEISDAAEAAAVAAGIKPGEAAPATPGNQPDPKLTAVPDPNPKVDPNDYKERYSRYKTQTDQTITDLRAANAASQQTIAAMQTQLADMQARINTPPSRQPTEPAHPDFANVEDTPAFKAYLAALPEKIKQEYDDTWIRDQFIIQQTANSTFKQPEAGKNPLEERVERMEQVANKTAAQLYEEQMDAAFPNDEWINLASGPEWNAFCAQKISTIDPRTYGEVVEAANKGHVAPQVIWVLNQYKHEQTLNQGTDTDDSQLAGMVTPDSGGNGSGDPITDLSAKTEMFTESQVNKFYADVSKGLYTPEESATIEANIIAANQAGNIRPG